MRTIKTGICLLALLLLSGCGQQKQQESISDAYERVDAVSILEPTTGAAGSTEAATTKFVPDNIEDMTFAESGPPKTVTSEATVVGPYDEVEYSGIRFQIEQVANSDHVDVIYEVMDKDLADAFKEQLLQGAYSKDHFENGGYVKTARRPDSQQQFVAIKCTMTNTLDTDRRIAMEFWPFLAADSDTDISELSSGGKIEASLLQRDGMIIDFYGVHDKYIPFGVGMETSDSNQYHVLKAGETFETVFFIQEGVAYFAGKTRYFCTAFLNGEHFNPMNIPKGAHLIPVELE